MRPLDYLRARDASDAVRSASSAGAKIIAGGTNLVDLMKLGVEAPAVLVDVTDLPFGDIEAAAFGLRLGALARNSDVAHHAAVVEHFPVLSEALLSGASAQLRNMATVGGNLMQRTRCPYFNDTATPCNKRRPGSGCSAIDGYNRSHAIFGTSDHCIATNPSDMNVALAALDAVVHLLGPHGERTVPVTQFHVEPGATPEIETVIQPGELIVGVDVPATGFARRSVYVKVRDRASYEFALVSVAAALEIDGGVVRQARLAFGGVGTKPWRALDAEKLLEGRPLTDAAVDAAADGAVKAARPAAFNAFKVELLRRTVRRALVELGGRS